MGHTRTGKIDRIACAWQTKRIVDKEAKFIHMSFARVIPKSKELAANPFDLPDVEMLNIHTLESNTSSTRLSYNIPDDQI
jgi:hypothetical protein